MSAENVISFVAAPGGVRLRCFWCWLCGFRSCLAVAAKNNLGPGAFFCLLQFTFCSHKYFFSFFSLILNMLHFICFFCQICIPFKIKYIAFHNSGPGQKLLTRNKNHIFWFRMIIFLRSILFWRNISLWNVKAENNWLPYETRML